MTQQTSHPAHIIILGLFHFHLHGCHLLSWEPGCSHPTVLFPNHGCRLFQHIPQGSSFSPRRRITKQCFICSRHRLLIAFFSLCFRTAESSTGVNRPLQTKSGKRALILANVYLKANKTNKQTDKRKTPHNTSILIFKVRWLVPWWKNIFIRLSRGRLGIFHPMTLILGTR